MILGTTFIHRKFIGFLCFLFKKYRRTRFRSFLHEKFIEFTLDFRIPPHLLAYELNVLFSMSEFRCEFLLHFEHDDQVVSSLYITQTI